MIKSRILDDDKLGTGVSRRVFLVGVKITVLWNDGEISEDVAADMSDTVLIYSEYTNDENFTKLQKFVEFESNPIRGSTITIKLTCGIATIEIL